MLVTLLITVIPIAYCGIFGREYSSPEIRGTVTDISTGKPVPGAIVIWRWSGNVSSLAHSHTVCYRIDLVVTDESGRYTVPAWNLRSGELPNIKNKNALPNAIAIYKSGYKEYLNSSIGAINSNTELKVEKIKNDKEYLESIGKIYGAPNCHYLEYTLKDETRESVIKLYSQVIEDIGAHIRDPQAKESLVVALRRRINDFRALQIKTGVNK